MQIRSYTFLHPRSPGVRRRDGGAPGPKRKLGRNPRVPFSSCQLSALETRFRQSQYLSSCDVAELSQLLQLTETRVSIVVTAMCYKLKYISFGNGDDLRKYVSWSEKDCGIIYFFIFLLLKLILIRFSVISYNLVSSWS